ncbi:MAG: hypothetical protein H0W45_09605 [Acidobacteria bacterium]|nr:hypothetical protein [Acidobacteriota bacterium]
MNEPKNTDFFHEINERDAHLVAPEIYQPYQETEEDRLHEELLKDFKAQIDEKFGAVKDDDLGELPFDDEADRKRWDELEKDFDRVFDEISKE